MSTGTDRLRKRTLALGLAVPFALAMAPCPAAAALHVHVHQTAPIHVHIEAPKHVDAHHVKGTKLPAATGTVLGPPAPAPAAVSGVLAITTAVLAPAGSIHAHTSRQHQAAAAVLTVAPAVRAPQAVASGAGAAPAGTGRPTVTADRDPLSAVVEPPVVPGSLSIGQAGSPLPANVPFSRFSLIAVVNVLIVLAVVRRRGAVRR